MPTITKKDITPKDKKLVEFDPLMEHDVRNVMSDLANLRNERLLKWDFAMDHIELDYLRDLVSDTITDYIHDALIEAYDLAAEETAGFYA